MSDSTLPVLPPLRSRWGPRWWGGVTLMLLFQLGLIFWLSERHAPAPRPPGSSPGFQLVGPGSAPVAALMDPTLFALPHREGFSGRAWLNSTNQQYEPFSWEDTPSWLGLRLEDLGAAFQEFIATNVSRSGRSSFVPEPEPSFPEPGEERVFAEKSSYRVVGELARRRLLTRLELPSWTNSDLLTNTIVQMLVDSQGRTVAPALLYPGCGLQQADAYALEKARAARFEPVSHPGPHRSAGPLAGLTWGQLIFEWRTVPKPLTNGAPAR